MLNCDIKIDVVFVFTQGPMPTVYNTVDVPILAKAGFTIPEVPIAAFPVQVPPLGVTDILITAVELLQYSGNGIIVGVKVAVTSTAKVFELGQIVGFGEDVVE